MNEAWFFVILLGCAKLSSGSTLPFKILYIPSDATRQASIVNSVENEALLATHPGVEKVSSESPSAGEVELNRKRIEASSPSFVGKDGEQKVYESDYPGEAIWNNNKLVKIPYALTDTTNHRISKRSFYTRNTRAVKESPIDKDILYIRNTRVLKGPPVDKGTWYIRNTRDVKDNSIDKDNWYIRNTKDVNGNPIGKDSWYIRNTRDIPQGKGVVKLARFMNHFLEDIDPRTFGRYNMYSPGHKNSLDEINVAGDYKSPFKRRYYDFKLGKRSAGCMLRCIDEGMLHPAQCHSLC